MRTLAAGACALLAFGCAASQPSQREFVSDGRYAMGTLLELTLAGVDVRSGSEILAELFDLAARLEQLMTRFDSTSQISQLNLAAGAGPQPVDPELAELLRRSVAYAQLTDGAFDVTVGPLVELWVEAAVAGALPTPAELERARQRVDAGAIRVLSDDRAELTRAGVVVDLGGIAKGFALDRMLPLLERRGIDAALLNFGQSSTLALGAPPDAAGWRLLVRGPEEEVLGVVTLRDQALSISSSFGDWLDIGGQRYGHVIDPRSGQALTRSAQAVIVAPDATLAEALSTALLVLSPDVGLALVASEPGCHGLLLDAEGQLHETPEFRRVTGWEAAESNDR